MSSYYNNIPIIQNITVDYGNIDTLDAKTVKTDNLFIDNDKSAENIITQSITLDTNPIDEIQTTTNSSYAPDNNKIMSSGKINELLAKKFSTSNIIKNNTSTSPSDTKIYSSLYVKNMLDNKIDDTELNNYYNKTETDNLLNDKVNNSTLNNYVLKNDTSKLTLNNSNSTITLNTLNASFIKGSNQSIDLTNNRTVMQGDFRIGGDKNGNWYLRVYGDPYYGTILGAVNTTITQKTLEFIGFGINRISFYFYGDKSTELCLFSKTLDNIKYFEYYYGNSFIDIFPDKIKLSNLTFDNTTIVNSIISSNDTTTSNDTSIPTTKWVKDNIISTDLSNYVQKTDTSQLNLNNTSSTITTGTLTSTTITSTNINNSNTIQSNTFKTGRSYFKENSDKAITFYYDSPSYGTYTILSLYGNGIETPGLRLGTKWAQSNNKTMSSFTTSTETTSPSDTSIPTTKWVYDKLYPIVNVLELIFDIPFNNNLNKVIIKDNEGSIPLYYYSVIGNPRKWQFTGNAVVLRNNTFTLYKNYIQLQQGDFYTYNLSNYDFKILTTYNSNKTVEHRDYMMASGYPIEINNYNVNNFQFATPYLLIKVMPGTMGKWEFHYYNDLKFVGNRNQATYTLKPTKNTLYFLCSNLNFSTSEYKFYYDLTLFYVSANSSSTYSGYPYHSLYSLEVDYSFTYDMEFNLDISTKPPYEEETNYAYAHHLKFKDRRWYNWTEPNGIVCDHERHEANVFYDKLTPRVIDSLT